MRRRIVLAIVASVAVGVPFVGGVAGATSGTLTITADTTLTEDHLGGIVIAADNVILDCAGFTVSSETSGSGVGVLVDGWDGVTVEDCTISGFGIGVGIVETTGSTFVENRVTQNRAGFVLEDFFGGVNDNVFDSNRVTNNGRGFDAIGASNNEFVRNRVTSNSGGGFFFFETAENSFVGNRVTRNLHTGILLVLSQDSIVSNNHVMDNGWAGIAIDRGSGHDVVMNRVMRNGTYGISLYSAFFMTIERNVACRNGILDAGEDPGEDLGTGNVWIDNRFCTSDI